MIFHRYLAHQMDACKYICILRRPNVESAFIVGGAGALEEAVAEELETPNPAVHEIYSADIENIYGGEAGDQLIKSIMIKSFTYLKEGTSGAGLWNVIAIMDEDNRALAIAYEKEYINTINVKEIKFTYTIEYDLTGNILHTGVAEYFLTHAKENTITSHALPSYLGTVPGELDQKTINVKSKSVFDGIYSSTKNDKYLDKECYISMTNTGPIVLYKYSESEWRATPYICIEGYESFDIPFTMPSEVKNILSLNAIDNFKGIVLDSLEGKYIWTLIDENKYSEPIKIVESDDYEILIPTFIDLCHCYIKIPHLNKKAPYYYIVKYWKELLNEGEGYLNDIDIPVHSSSIVNPDSNYYVEPLTSKLDGSYLTSTDESRHSPITALANMMTSNPGSKPEGFDGNYSKVYEGARMLYLNLRMMVTTYVDTFNKGKYKLTSVTPCDCGLDIQLEDGRYFITYFGRRYILPLSCKISGMTYYTGSGIYDIATRDSILKFDKKLYSYKYGIPVIGG